MTLTGPVPSDGSEVDVTDFGMQDAYNNQRPQTARGTVAGVPMILTRHAKPESAAQTKKWTLRLATPGPAVEVPDRTPFIFDEALLYKSYVNMIWAGRNDGRHSFERMHATRDNILMMADYATNEGSPFLVISICNGAGETKETEEYARISEVNHMLADVFGPNFVDLRSYMVRDGIKDAKFYGRFSEQVLPPTLQDVIDMEGDTIPQSLRRDKVHFSQAGVHTAADYLLRQLRGRGL
ncbi:hypothetical protein [Mangrovicoccus ximenensis]|uniref:hypothetical protein n=1 Tax=Mangrovicoccus ximenensis TaxID=1911570 RepID=UPI0011AE9599|nr:hypothetical protein [Mangrovicoccus ximenensis]